MTKPLALVFYEELLPGSQLVNRLQDLGYRVSAYHEGRTLASKVTEEKPIVVLMDLTSKEDVCGVIKKLKGDKSTEHIPILAFTNGRNKKLPAQARAAGATLVAAADGLLPQLPQLLEQVLQVD